MFWIRIILSYVLRLSFIYKLLDTPLVRLGQRSKLSDLLFTFFCIFKMIIIIH